MERERIFCICVSQLNAVYHQKDGRRKNFGAQTLHLETVLMRGE